MGKQNPIRQGLAVGIIIIFMGLSIVPSIASNIVEEKMDMPYLDKATIYVDDDFNESTPGWNVTHFDSIICGIEASETGGTVFVYSGFYNEGEYEVTKSIDIIGEDKDTTIVGNNAFVFRFMVDNNKLCGFTFQNCDTGIGLYSHNNIICCNIFQNIHKIGLSLGGSDNNLITGNNFINNGEYELPFRHGAISCANSNHNIIVFNHFESNSYGFNFNGGDGNLISNNVIVNSSNSGIYLRETNVNIIISNHIVNNNIGVRLNNNIGTLIKKNNIYNNTESGLFERHIFHILNRWVHNYWGPLVLPPKIISGELHTLDRWDYYYGWTFNTKPSFQFDWRPALRPYNIGEIDSFSVGDNVISHEGIGGYVK